MYGGELPACLFKQITKLGDCTFLAIEITHHLRCVKKFSSVIRGLSSIPLPSHQNHTSWSRDRNLEVVASGAREALRQESHV